VAAGNASPPVMTEGESMARWLIGLTFCWLVVSGLATSGQANDRPNILLAISDDQSFAHTSSAGYAAVETPAFDRVAREGVLFRNAICGSPGCSPSRAALLTGRYPWQLQQAGTHASSFPAEYRVYPDILEQAGYFVGYTGKGWGPGNWQVSGRARNPAGVEYNRRQLKQAPTRGISKRDYAGNFEEFLADCPKDRPFCFWYGGYEPHRAFESGSGERAGKDPAAVGVPGFLPDVGVVRQDLLDYCLEIENFDHHLNLMLKQLEERGELDNTLVVVTSDNGMAFPRAKANCYEYGIHVPLAIRWPRCVQGQRVVDDVVSFVDLAPTFLEAAGLPAVDAMAGRSLGGILKSAKSGVVEADREQVFSARERHSSSRYNNWTYPQRALRTGTHLLVRNFRPERWPAGDPQKYNGADQLGPPHGGYHDIDACPTLTLLVAGREDPAIARFFHLAVDKRPEWELFDIRTDPDCLKNLADEPEHGELTARLQEAMERYLRKTGDPRILDGGEVFETYRRYSPIRKFPPPDAALQP
jgi:N-sulfoglucosamine sulfohydrolase